MPGLLVALAVLAVVAMGGAQAASLPAAKSERWTLKPGRRYRLDASFDKAPDQAQFTEVLKGAFPGIENVAWTSPKTSTITLSPAVDTPVTIGVPDGGITMTSVSDVGPAGARVAGELPAPAPALQSPPMAFLVTLETDHPILDKQSFESVLKSRLRAFPVRFAWADSRHVGVVVVSRRDLSDMVGLRKPVRSVPVTVTGVMRLPTEA